MNKKIIILFTILALIIVSSCTIKTSSKLQTNEKDIQLKDKIVVSIFETITQEKDGRHIILYLEANKTYSCVGYSLNADFGKQGNEYVVDIKGINFPSDDACLTALDRAEFSKDLGLIEGNYKLIVRYDNKEDSYNIDITKYSIKIEPISSSFTTILSSDTIARFPPESIEVRCSDRKPFPSNICINFYTELENLGAIKSEDEYARYTRENTLGSDFSILYDYSGDIEKIKNLLSNYSQYNNTLIFVSTWKGDYFTSLLLIQ